MSDQWYWKHRDDILGPLATEDLERLIQSRRVADRDEIRLATSSEWISGAEAKKLFAEGKPLVSSSEAAALLLSQVDGPRRISQIDTAPGSGILSTSWERIQGFAKDQFESITGAGERLGALLARSLDLLRILANRKVLFILVAVTFVGVITTQLKMGNGAYNHRVLDELAETSDRLQLLQANHASHDEWQAFRETTLPKLDVTLTSLTRDSEPQSGTSYDTLTSLLFPGREWKNRNARRAMVQAILALKNVITEATESEGRPSSAEIFEKHMNVAREVLDDHYQQRMADRRIASTRRRPNQSVSIDSSIWGILIFDGVLVAGGLWYWLRTNSQHA